MRRAAVLLLACLLLAAPGRPASGTAAPQPQPSSAVRPLPLHTDADYQLGAASGAPVAALIGTATRG